MANNKIDRINKEIAKTREKITEYAIRLPFLPIRTRYRRSPLRGNGRVQNLRMVQSCGHIRKVERWRRSHKRPPPSFPVSNLSYAQVVLKVLAIV